MINKNDIDYKKPNKRKKYKILWAFVLISLFLTIFFVFYSKRIESIESIESIKPNQTIEENDTQEESLIKFKNHELGPYGFIGVDTFDDLYYKAINSRLLKIKLPLDQKIADLSFSEETCLILTNENRLYSFNPLVITFNVESTQKTINIENFFGNFRELKLEGNDIPKTIKSNEGSCAIITTNNELYMFGYNYKYNETSNKGEYVFDKNPLKFDLDIKVKEIYPSFGNIYLIDTLGEIYSLDKQLNTFNKVNAFNGINSTKLIIANNSIISIDDKDNAYFSGSSSSAPFLTNSEIKKEINNEETLIDVAMKIDLYKNRLEKEYGFNSFRSVYQEKGVLNFINKIDNEKIKEFKDIENIENIKSIKISNLIDSFSFLTEEGLLFYYGEAFVFLRERTEDINQLKFYYSDFK